MVSRRADRQRIYKSHLLAVCSFKTDLHSGLDPLVAWMIMVMNVDVKDSIMRRCRAKIRWKSWIALLGQIHGPLALMHSNRLNPAPRPLLPYRAHFHHHHPSTFLILDSSRPLFLPPRPWTERIGPITPRPQTGSVLAQGRPRSKRRFDEQHPPPPTPSPPAFPPLLPRRRRTRRDERPE